MRGHAPSESEMQDKTMSPASLGALVCLPNIEIPVLIPYGRLFKSAFCGGFHFVELDQVGSHGTVTGSFLLISIVGLINI